MLQNKSEAEMKNETENKKAGDLTPVREIISTCPLFKDVQECEALAGETAITETITPEAEAVIPEGESPSGNTPAEEPDVTESAAPEVRDDIPGTPDYNWKKYGYTRITEDTFCGGPHPGDYEKDGVLHCGYCHKPKYVLHTLFCKTKAYPIDCDCKRECRNRIAEERRRRQEREHAELCRCHALPHEYMRHWDFAHDDGGSPRITSYARRYAEHFAEMKRRGEGLFLFGVAGTGKTYAAVQIVNALCDQGYRCLVTSFLDIVNTLLSMNRENRQGYIDDICRHDLIVFDNYGTEPSTYFSDMNVLKIINTCYDRHVPMIVTTSLSPEILNKGTNVTRNAALLQLKKRCYCLTLANIQRRNRQAKERAARFRDLLGIEKEPEAEASAPLF